MHKNTEKNGFQTFNNYRDLSNYIFKVINTDMNFFSSMLPKKKLGNLICLSSKEKTDTLKGKEFLKLMQGAQIE